MANISSYISRNIILLQICVFLRADSLAIVYLWLNKGRDCCPIAPTFVSYNVHTLFFADMRTQRRSQPSPTAMTFTTATMLICARICYFSTATCLNIPRHRRGIYFCLEDCHIDSTLLFSFHCPAIACIVPHSRRKEKMKKNWNLLTSAASSCITSGLSSQRSQQRYITRPRHLSLLERQDHGLKYSDGHILFNWFLHWSHCKGSGQPPRAIGAQPLACFLI